MIPGPGPESEPVPLFLAVPAGVADLARSAFSARDPHADLAEVVEDSLDDQASDPTLRTVSFAGAGLHVLVRRAADALVVEVDPTPDGRLEVEDRRTTRLVVTPTGVGRWEVQPVPAGPVSLVVHDGARRVRTAWTRW